MGERNYTLEDPLYKEGLVRGSDSEGAFEETRRLLIVGGAAVQLTARDRPELLRPTTDVDFIVDGSTQKSARRRWANYLGDILREGGHKVSNGLTRYGAEARFEDVNPDLILHLDCFGPAFFARHSDRLRAEYERAVMEDIHGISVRYQSPGDIIANKVRRVHALENSAGVELDSFQTSFFDSVEAGDFDSLDTDGLPKMLDGLLKQRAANVEELGRLGYGGVMGAVNGYKVGKDVYDISLVVDACRRKGEEIGRVEFRDHLRLTLVP